MVKHSTTPDRAERKRRQQQSTRDREQQHQQRQQRAQASRGQQSLYNQRLYWPVAPVHQMSYYACSIKSESTSMAQGLSGTTVPTSVATSGATFDSLFNNSQYSDVIVYLGEAEVPFAAHRVVLGTRCSYFADMLQSGLKESITNEIKFEKDSPHALWRVLQYIYTGDYSDEPSEALHSEGDDLELFKHHRVFALADMFRIPELKTIACRKLKEQLQQHWISDTFPDAIREVYLTSNGVDTTSTRKIVVDAAVLHVQALIGRGPFKELIREIGDFAVDLSSRMAENDCWVK